MYEVVITKNMMGRRGGNLIEAIFVPNLGLYHPAWKMYNLDIRLIDDFELLCAYDMESIEDFNSYYDSKIETKQIV